MKLFPSRQEIEKTNLPRERKRKVARPAASRWLACSGFKLKERSKKVRERKEIYCRWELNPRPNYCRERGKRKRKRKNRERDEVVAQWANRREE